MVFPPIAKEGTYLGSDRLVPKWFLSLEHFLVPLPTLLESSGSSPFAIDSFQERLNRNGVRERQIGKPRFFSPDHADAKPCRVPEGKRS